MALRSMAMAFRFITIYNNDLEYTSYFIYINILKFNLNN